MPTAYWPGGGQVDADLLALAAEEPVGRADEDAGAVAAVGLAAAGPAVAHVLEHQQGCWTILLEALPLMWQMKPTPQESCSNRGSYRPCAGGSRAS